MIPIVYAKVDAMVVSVVVVVVGGSRRVVVLIDRTTKVVTSFSLPNSGKTSVSFRFHHIQQDKSMKIKLKNEEPAFVRRLFHKG